MTETTQHVPYKLAPTRLSVRLLSLLAVVGLLALAGPLVLSPLPRGAYPVLSTALWAGRSPLNPCPHAWLPNGDLAYLATDANGMLQVCYQKMDNSGPVGAVRHGPELPLGNGLKDFFPSPDEQWVATMQFTPPRQFQTFLTSADGKTTQKGNRYFSGWLPDSSSYFAIPLLPTKATKIFHLDAAATETIPETEPGDLPTATMTLAGSPNFVVGCHFYNPGSNPGTPQNYPWMVMRSFSASRPGVVLQTWRAAVPKDMTFGSPTVSPNNKYLLWSVGKRKFTPLSDWLGNVNVKWRKDPTSEMYYFLSDLYGNHMRPVLTNVMGGSLAINPMWTPDSKHLSFIYNDQLYLVPVE